MENQQPAPAAGHPWHGTIAVCRVHPPTSDLLPLLRDKLAGEARFPAGTPGSGDEVILVDCRTSADELAPVRRQHPAQPVVAVLPRTDADLKLLALASGADGIIAAGESAETWRECLHVVRGGGRWLDGPGLGVHLEHKYASYEVSRREHLRGDVTMRTRQFVQSRLKDRFRR